MCIVELIQRKYFTEEISLLRKGKTLLGSSKLSRLNPFLDDLGFLRIDGRLTNSDMLYDICHICLTGMKVRDAGYWILNLVASVSSMIFKCLHAVSYMIYIEGLQVS